MTTKFFKHLLFFGFTGMSLMFSSGCPTESPQEEPPRDMSSVVAPPERFPDFSAKSPSGVRLFLYPAQSQGLRNDYAILERLIAPKEPIFNQENSSENYAKINLFLELVIPKWKDHAASNWLMVNQEFVQDPTFLKIVDVVLCKTRRCMTLMNDYKERYALSYKIHYTGFTSDVESSNLPLDYDKILHAAGKSGLKNTGAVIDVWANNSSFPPIFMTCRSDGSGSGCYEAHAAGRPYAESTPNINFKKHHIAWGEYKDVIDHAGIHVAPSAIEGFGHCINEGKSNGAIVITTDAPPMNELIVEGETGFLVPAISLGTFNRFSNEVSYKIETTELENAVKKALALPLEQKQEMGRKAKESYKLEADLFRERLDSILDSALNGPGSSQKRFSFAGRRDRFTIVGWDTDFKAFAAVKALRSLGYDAELVASKTIDNKMGRMVAESENNPNVRRHYVIWWSWKEHIDGLSVAPLKKLIEQSRKSNKMVNILYNFDDPYCWLDTNHDLNAVSALFDYAFVTSAERLGDYQKNGARAFHLLPASDEETHFYEPKPEFRADVSMVISDFYDPKVFPALVSRAKIAQELCDAPGIDFRLYGPEHLRKTVPKCYKGYADQKTNRQIFASSKINIATHALDGAGYMSDRVPFILMSKGLMLIDPVDVSRSVFTEGENCLVIDLKRDIVDQVRSILALPQAERDRISSNGLRLAIQKMSYRAWANQLTNTIGAR